MDRTAKKVENKSNPTTTGHDAILHLKISVATLEHHLELCDNFNVVREYENRIKNLLNKISTKRILLQSEKP